MDFIDHLETRTNNLTSFSPPFCTFLKAIALKRVMRGEDGAKFQDSFGANGDLNSSLLLSPLAPKNPKITSSNNYRLS